MGYVIVSVPGRWLFLSGMMDGDNQSVLCSGLISAKPGNNAGLCCQVSNSGINLYTSAPQSGPAAHGGCAAGQAGRHKRK